ncbi:MAG TPA: SRPBCC family protein [Bdellovibrionota bacterium]|jgi:ribosome-associated toxin RatA of RatAB toxin-antitoxin module
MAGANHTTVFDVSLDALWDVITDYEGYVDFVEGLESLEVTKRDGKDVYANYTVSMLGKTVRYSLKHTESPKKGLKWEMIEGEFFKFNNGGWDLKAKGDNKVEATYTVDVGFPLLVPKAIVNTLTSTQLPAMMKAFEDRAKSKAKKSGKAGKGKK